jgi:hypothetical protein
LRKSNVFPINNLFSSRLFYLHSTINDFFDLCFFFFVKSDFELINRRNRSPYLSRLTRAVFFLHHSRTNDRNLFLFDIYLSFKVMIIFWWQSLIILFLSKKRYSTNHFRFFYCQQEEEGSHCSRAKTRK